MTTPATSPAPPLSPVINAEYETRSGNRIVVTGVKQLPAGRWVVGEINDRHGVKVGDFSGPLESWRSAVVREVEPP